MAKFLDAELVRLVKDVGRAEIPRDQRTGAAAHGAPPHAGSPAGPPARTRGWAETARATTAA